MLDILKKRWQQEKGRKRAAGKGHHPLPTLGSEIPEGDSGGTPTLPEVKRKIMLVGQEHTFSAGVLDYAVHLAARLDYDLIALNVNPALPPGGKFFSPYQRHLRQKFSQRARAAWAEIQPEMASKGIKGEQVVKFGDLAQAVQELHHEFKRIDFVITAQDLQDEELRGEIPLPVFSITGFKGEKVMAEERERKRLTPWGKTLVFGTLTAALYAAVFLNGGTVMNYFTRGGWYAALPIATVFVFSFFHGAFANYLWLALGIEAVKRVQPRPEAKRPVKRRRPRPELRLNA